MKILNEKNIDREVVNTGDTRLVLFFADWCRFCTEFKPVFESYEEKTNLPLAEAKVNDEENPMWGRFKIEFVPTIILFRNGRMIARRDAVPGMGLMEEDLKGILNKTKQKLHIKR